MTVGRPITAGRSRDRCVSNVVSNPISDAARAPSPLYRARGQRRPSAASGLPIRNDFGTLSRVDRFQHGESQLIVPRRRAISVKYARIRSDSFNEPRAFRGDWDRACSANVAWSQITDVSSYHPEWDRRWMR